MTFLYYRNYICLLTYAYIASTLPVQALLQPRDYIDSHQLFIALTMLALGTAVAKPVMVAPAMNLSPTGAPPLIPMLFVVVACGAISGFHALVASGTSSKQCDLETSVLSIGYGGMLLEGLLAVFVLIACGAGIRTRPVHRCRHPDRHVGLFPLLCKLGRRLGSRLQNWRVYNRRGEYNQRHRYPPQYHSYHHGRFCSILCRHLPGHGHPDSALNRCGVRQILATADPDPLAAFRCHQPASGRPCVSGGDGLSVATESATVLYRPAHGVHARRYRMGNGGQPDGLSQRRQLAAFLYRHCYDHTGNLDARRKRIDTEKKPGAGAPHAQVKGGVRRGEGVIESGKDPFSVSADMKKFSHKKNKGTPSYFRECPFPD